MHNEICNVCGTSTLLAGSGPTTVGVRENGNGTLTLTVAHTRCLHAFVPNAFGTDVCTAWTGNGGQCKLPASAHAYKTA